jgi:hypothetical protein
LQFYDSLRVPGTIWVIISGHLSCVLLFCR